MRPVLFLPGTHRAVLLAERRSRPSDGYRRAIALHDDAGPRTGATVVAPPMSKIAVIGSGVAALSATRALGQLASQPDSALSGSSITLFTSRSKFTTQIGPRNQTPPRNGVPFYDYACQYLTADEPWFADELRRWLDLGLASALPEGAVGVLSEHDGFRPFADATCVVGNGGMWPMMSSLLVDAATSSPHVEHVSGFPDERRRVVGLSRGEDGCWMLATKGGELEGPFDIVLGGFAQHVLTDPFLASGGEASAAMLRCLRRVEFNQIIACQVAMEGPALPATFAAAHCVCDEVLSFVGNNSRKPHQDGSVPAEAGVEAVCVSHASRAVVAPSSPSSPSPMRFPCGGRRGQ